MHLNFMQFVKIFLNNNFPKKYISKSYKTFHIKYIIYKLS